MFNSKHSALALSFACLLSPITSSHAQFYAPDTDYHDLAQRVAVTEIARVLAWRENERKPAIEEVTYKVSRDAEGQTTWDIQWLTKSASVRKVQVQYPESLLLKGPEFYRFVFKELWSIGWRPVEKASESDIVAAVWRGADRFGLSRLEGLQKAFNTETTAPEADRAAALAGLLQMCALPSLSGAVSLDAVLLGRSAAWLCLAEQMVSQRSTLLDAYWAPTLFMAGREKDAVALWKQGTASKFVGDAVRGWDFLLQTPGAKEAFLFAAKDENERFAFPIMIYYAHAAGIGNTITEVLPVFVRKPKVIYRLTDYAPYLAVNTGVAGGRFLEGAWPALARSEWLSAMRSVPFTPFDYRGYTNVLENTIAEVERASKRDSDEDTDRSLLALKEAAPMLQEAFREGTGKLAPVAVATARDVLNYGWESTCLQFETRHRFVEGMWGVKELADSIRSNSWLHVPGLHAWWGAFSRDKIKSAEQLPVFPRLQLVDASNVHFKRLPARFWGKDDQEEASIYPKRCWLRAGQIPAQAARLVRNDQIHEVVPLIKRLRAEGGPSFDLELLNYLVNQIPYATAMKIPGKQRLQEEIAQDLIEPSILQVNVLWEKKYQNMPPFQRAQEFESMFWKSPTTRLHVWAYENYILANAYQTASRFYEQVAAILDEPIQFSNQLGLQRWVQAWVAGDPAAMKKALRDSNSGSANHMLMLMWQAVVDDNIKELQRWNNEAIERYSRAQASGSMQQRFRSFLPLLPALKDPKHADHTKSLNYFASDADWAVMQWIMIKQYKLSTEAAILFLGGEDTDAIRRAMVLYLKKDKERFAKHFDAIKQTDAFSKSRFILITSMRNELLDVPVPQDQPDLRPKEAQTIAQAVLRAAGLE